MKCAFITFGCKVNQYETQLLREQFAAVGVEEVAPTEPADIYIVNTCAVTERASRKSVSALRRAARAAGARAARVVAAGCLVDLIGKKLLEVKGVTDIFTNRQKVQIPALIGAAVNPSPLIEQTIHRFSGHTRAFLKVQDGCDSLCAYCLLPKVRGRPISKRPGLVLTESHHLAENGYKEAVLTGIHLGLYGKDLDCRTDLVTLLESLIEENCFARIRLSSIEVGEVSERLLALIAASDKICPHLPAPLQSGSDTVLKIMRRNYTQQQYLNTIAQIQKKLDRPAITTDIIVGFPSETEEDFEETLRVVEAVGFARVHIFPFSPRPGTVAAMLPNRIPRQVVKARTERLKQVAASAAQRYRESLRGTIAQVLIERQHAGISAGYSERYIYTQLTTRDNIINQIVDAPLA